MVVGKNDNALLLVMMLSDGVLNWVRVIKYLGVCLHSQKGLRVNSSINCRNLLGASFGILQGFGYLSEEVLCEIIFKKCLLILTYGMECFELLGEQRHRMSVAFNTVARQIFKLSKYTSVHNVIFYIGSKPCDIILDERRFLLLQSCM